MWALALVTMLALACWWSPDPGLGYTDDDARMILEARRLWAGSWPIYGVQSHAGMAVLFAPLAESMVAMHKLMAVLFGVCVWMTVELAGRQNRTAGIVAAAFVATSPMLLSYSCQIMTEIPFTAVSLAALVLAQRKRWLWALVVAMLACTFRSIGIVAVGAIFLAWVLQCHKDRTWNVVAMLAAVALAAMALWFVARTHGIGLEARLLAGSPWSGAITWAELPGRVLENIVMYLFDYGPYALLSQTGGIAVVAGVGVLVTAGLGVLSLRSPLLFFYLALYGAALIVCSPDLSGTRYVVPLLPIAFLGLVTVAVDMWPRTVAWTLPAAVCGVVAVTLTAFRVSIGPMVPEGFGAYFAMAEYAATLPPGSVIGCRKSGAMQLLSGHTSLMYPFADPATVRAWIHDQGITHIVSDVLSYSQTGKYLVPAIADKNGVPRPGYRPVAKTFAERQRRGETVKYGVVPLGGRVFISPGYVMADSNPTY